MSLLELIKRDANTITTNLSEFSEPGTFIAPTGEEATVNVIHTKHHLTYDLQNAQEVNSMKAHACVSEQELIDLSYPVRDSSNKVNLKGHKFKGKDANGLEWTYVIEEWFPNDKVGVISIILGSHKQ